MDLKKLENKVNIITNKLRVGKFDEVIRDSKLLIKKFSDQQILYNILSLAYQQKGENDKSIDLYGSDKDQYFDEKTNLNDNSDYKIRWPKDEN